jgi:DNA polymerase-1
MSKPPFILVDGSSYLFRAYHALPPLTNSQGKPTGAIVGVINMIKKLMAEYQPEHMAVVFDAPGKTFRDDMYAEYKANRPPAPDELKQQIQPLHDIIRAMGLPLLIIDGVEADDVIGTLTRQASAKGMDTLVSTGDKDMAQLVDKHVTLINTMSGTVMDRQGVYDKFAVWPEQIIDYLALMGDTVDNIPGVYKCGPKTAAKWLAEYQTLDQVIENAGEIKGKIGENLRDALDQLPLSRELTTIKTDVDLEFSPEQLSPKEADTQKLRELFSEIEARRLLADLDKGDSSAAEVESSGPKIETDYSIVLTEPELDTWLDKIKKAPLFAFDTETTSLNYMQAELVGVSFCIEAGEAAYVPVAHSYPGAEDQLSRDTVLEKLKPILEDEAIKKVGQNLKYDMSVLARYDINLQGIAFDTMLESYVLDSTGSRHNMDALAEKYLNHTTIHFEDIAGKGKKQLTFDQIEIEKAGPYAAEDADITLRLHQVLWPQLEPETRLAELLRTLEVPLLTVLSRIERNGVRIDTALLNEQSNELARRLHDLEQQAYAIAGREFNMGSPKQIGQIFFEELELPVVAKTPKGAPSTAENVLQELAEMGHELPGLLLEHRGLSKLKSTYVDTLPKMVDPDTGRVHTSYHQAVAATGRLSSSDPNLQNIPVRTEEGRKIRKAFIPANDHVMVAADYSQIELRIMAHLSADKGLLDAFSRGLDVHSATAAEVFAVDSLDAVTSDQRRSAKAVNFGLIYGMSAFGLAKQLNIGRAEAQSYVDLYFERYPGVKDFMDSTRELAHEKGFVETIFGRRLYLPEINSRNGMRRQAAERTAINAPMQGSAADIIKRAMLDVDGWLLQQNNASMKMLMQVHDELVFEIHRDNLESSISEIKSRMENAAKLNVPLVVDVGQGMNWEEAH